MNHLVLSAALIVSLLMSSTIWAEVAGFVLLAKGGTFAQNPAGEQRPLKRRSKIMEGDIITTDAVGMLQIRFVDKALLTLKANSQLNITDYQLAKAQGEGEAVVMDLLKGGFRTITGSIGKGDKNAYKVKTPAASIGIRGTNYEVAQETGESFVMAVWEGGIDVSNDQGTIEIGQGNDYMYVRVTPTTEPQGLEEPPEVLAITATPPQKESNEDNTEQSNESEEGSDTEQTSTDSEDQTDEQGETGEASDESDEEIAELTQDSENDTSTTDEAQESAKESELDNEIAEAEEEANAIVNEPLPDLTQITSVDTRFTDWEYTYLVERPKAALIISDENSTVENALVVQDTEAGTNPVFVIAGTGSGDNNVESFALDVENGVAYEANVSGNSNVSWGQWNDEVEYFNTVNDTSQSTTEVQNFYWLSAEAATLSTLRGTASFSGNSDYLGDINGEAISSFSSQFDVNFNNGAITNGNMNMGNGTESWSMTYDGNVTGANASMTNIQGSVTGGSGACTGCVSGDIQGIFARPGSQFVGGFKLQTDQSGQADGVFSLQGTRTE